MSHNRSQCSQYFDEHGKYLHTDTVFSGGAVKLIRSDKWALLKQRFRAQLNDTNKTYGELVTALATNSKTVEMENGIASRLRELVDSLPAGKERIGYLYLEIATPLFRFYLDSSSYQAESAPFMWGSGGNFASRPGTLTLASIHTHPEELKYLRQGVTDQDIFEAQYRGPKSDGNHAVNGKTLIYTIGARYTDYYSPKGHVKSKNNVCTNTELTNGHFNIMKHALRTYGNAPGF